MAKRAIYRTCELGPAAAQLSAHKCCRACLGEEDAVPDLRREDGGWEQDTILSLNPSSHWNVTLPLLQRKAVEDSLDPQKEKSGGEFG
jgi:hypothetical protein